MRGASCLAFYQTDFAPCDALVEEDGSKDRESLFVILDVVVRVVEEAGACGLRHESRPSNSEPAFNDVGLDLFIVEHSALYRLRYSRRPVGALHHG